MITADKDKRLIDPFPILTECSSDRDISKHLREKSFHYYPAVVLTSALIISSSKYRDYIMMDLTNPSFIAIPEVELCGKVSHICTVLANLSGDLQRSIRIERIRQIANREQRACDCMQRKTV